MTTFNFFLWFRSKRTTLGGLSTVSEATLIDAGLDQLNSGHDVSTDKTGGFTDQSSFVFPYLSDLAQLSHIDAIEHSVKQPIFIGGGLVQYALSNIDNDNPDFVRQPDRSAGNGLSAAKLRVWVHREIVAIATRGKPRRRMVLAIDSLIRYGCRQSRTSQAPLILVHGAPVQDHTLLHLFTFVRGTLTAIDEYTAQSQNGYRFAPEIESLLKRHLQADVGQSTTSAAMLMPQASFLVSNDELSLPSIQWTAPLKPLDLPQLDNIGLKPFERPVQRAIRWQSSTLARAIRFPFVLLILSIAVYVGIATWHIGKFNQARQQQALHAKNVEALPVNLDTLRARRTWLEPNPTFDNEIARLNSTLNVLGKHSEWFVLSLNVPGNQTANNKDNKPYELVIRLPRDTSAPLEQARPVLTELSNSTGSNLYLPAVNAGQPGWREINTDGKKWLELTIIGAPISPLATETLPPKS